MNALAPKVATLEDLLAIPEEERPQTSNRSAPRGTWGGLLA